MFTFFNNQTCNRNYTRATAATLALGNVIWLICAANAIGPSDRAVLTCFHHNNITDANLVPTEACSEIINEDGRGGHRSCSIVEVYDQYTLDHCGTQMQHSVDAQASATFAIMTMAITLVIGALYACSRRIDTAALQNRLTELMPIGLNGDSACMPLNDNCSGSAYDTFAVVSSV